MDVEVVRRAGHLDCARTSAQYGAADARDGARVTLGVAPGILERGAPWGGPRCTRGSEVPRIRALVEDDGRPDVVTRMRRIGEVGVVHSWATPVAP